MAARSKIDWLVDDPCENLGFSLPARAREQLEEIGLDNIVALADAVFAAESLDSNNDKALRHQVRALVSKYADA